MSIRFDSALNKEMRRIVKNFNEKRKRAIRRGFTNLPDKIYVSDLKRRYESRELLKKELKLLEQFNKEKDKSLEIIETLEGGRLIKWEYEYLKSNLNAAKKFYDREIKEAAQSEEPFSIARSEYINNLRSKRKFLELELIELNTPQLRTYRKTIDEYLSSSKRDLDSYRGWLKEVEIIMRQLGYDNKTINRFFDGFSNLTPRQFVKLYRENNLVSRIYELYIPSKDRSFRLSTDEDDAKQIINTFMQEKDQMIEKAKKY